jgi:heat shock protein HtpX
MWEAIQSNIRRSRAIVVVMAMLLVSMGAAVGGAWIGSLEGAAIGAVAALMLWLILLAVSMTGGDQLILMSAGARRIEKEDAPVLWNVVEEMTIAAGLGTMPSIHVIDNDQPNAFATGRKPEKSAVAVTTGLLRRLNRDELQGVIAHEIGHIKNYDIRFLTTATVMVGAIVIISDVFVRSLWFGGGRRRSSGKGEGQVIFLILALVMAILAPLFANLLYYSVSRKREYLADASAARYTRYPLGLAAALRKISGSVHGQAKAAKKSTARALAPMYIVNPLQLSGGGGSLMATHPPTEKRIAVLEAMSGGAGWQDYENAFKKINGEGCLPTSVTGAGETVAMRQATAEANPKSAAVDRSRVATDLLDRFAGLLLIPCACGVRIKAPAGARHKEISCPKCGTRHEIPRAGEEQAVKGKEAPQTLTYRRKGKGWDSFECACGRAHQISPAMKSGRVTCPKCKRKIEITA